MAGLSFSPGRAFARKGPNDEPAWCEGVTIPIFMTWAPDELDDDRRDRFNHIASPVKILYEQNTGVQGSSTLRPDKNPDGYEAIWPAVMDFLEHHSK